MAKHKDKELDQETLQQEKPSESSTELVPLTDVKSLFSRDINGGNKIKSLRLGKTLTRPLIAMTHEKRLLFTCKSEMYTMELKGKTAKSDYAEARVVDGIAYRLDKEGNQTSEECTLIFNEMMVGGLSRGGFTVLLPTETVDGGTEYKANGETLLTDHSFAFQLMGVNEDKGYKVIDCREVFLQLD